MFLNNKTAFEKGLQKVVRLPEGVVGRGRRKAHQWELKEGF